MQSRTQPAEQTRAVADRPDQATEHPSREHQTTEHQTRENQSMKNRPVRPDYLPEKFWDTQTGSVRIETLARSYREMEKQFSGGLIYPGEQADDDKKNRFFQKLGVPEGPEKYEIDADSAGFMVDEEINKRLHEANFTQDQAQLFYDLAMENLEPYRQQLEKEFLVARDEARLEARFGGAAQWQEIRRQLNGWAKAHLPDDARNSMAMSYEGVIALYGMMTAAGEPEMFQGGSGGQAERVEDLHRLMQDPGYWRDHNPTLIERVSEGFRRLYPS